MEAHRCQARRLPLLALLALLVLSVSGAGVHAAQSTPREDGGLRALYTSLDGSVTRFWVARGAAPDRPVAAGAVAHRDGYGVRARPSPDGTSAALTLWPPGDAGTAAELWVLSLASGEARRVLVGVDLHSTPVWSRDGQRVVVRRGTSLWVVAVGTGTVSPLVDAGPVHGVYPFAWSPDGVYFAVIDGGTAVHRAGVGCEGQEMGTSGAWSGTGAGCRSGPVVDERLFRASEGIARDFALLPSGAIAYLEVTPGGLAARTVDVTGAPVSGIERVVATAVPPLPRVPGYVEFAGWLP